MTNEVIRIHDQFYILSTSGRIDDRTRVRYTKIPPANSGQKGACQRRQRENTLPRATSRHRIRNYKCSFGSLLFITRCTIFRARSLSQSLIPK